MKAIIHLNKLSPINEASYGRVNVKFRVNPKGQKVLHVKDLNEIPKKLSEKEIRGSNISILLNAEVVGQIDTEILADMMF